MCVTGDAGLHNAHYTTKQNGTERWTARGAGARECAHLTGDPPGDASPHHHVLGLTGAQFFLKTSCEESQVRS